MKYYNFSCGCSFPILKESSSADTLPKLDIDIRNINEDCPAVWDLLAKGLTTGIWQLETETGKSWVQKVKPRSIQDLGALGALLRPGCISKDTQITTKIFDRKTRRYGVKKISIEKLYRKFHRNHALSQHDIVSCNEQDYLLFNNKILDIFYNGKKDVVVPKFRNLKKSQSKKFYSLECTLDHKLLTSTRGWVELQNIQIGERVAVIRTTKDITRSDIVYFKREKSFRDVCFANYEYRCIFCDWKEAFLDVNHIDGNRKTNNHHDNLCFMCPNHHRKFSEGLISKEETIEAKNKFKLKNTKNIGWAEYTGYEFLGEKDVYDIKVEGPNHNFIAGNVIVHNCLNAKDSEGVSLTEHYCRRKNGQEEVSYPHPELEPVLRETYGILTYQEQTIETLKILGGFNLIEADMARRGIGKKKADIVEEVRKLFLKKSQEVGKVSLEKAEEIFGLIKAGERYSFNKSHSISYAIFTYQTSYIKVHDPINFFVSKLRHAHYKQDSFEKISDLVTDGKLFNVEVKLPDLRKKRKLFWTDDKHIHYGLTDIKGIGDSVYHNIKTHIELAENSLNKKIDDFSFLEFCLFCGYNLSETTLKLIRSGALDFFKLPRTEMLYLFNLIKDLTEKVEIPASQSLYLKDRPKNFEEFFEKASKTIKEGGVTASKPRAKILSEKLKTIKEPTTNLNDSISSIVWDEEDLLGVAISQSEMDNVDGVTGYCKDVLNGKPDVITLAVKVKHIHTNIIKTGPNTGKEMAKLKVADSTGTILGLAFSETWNKMKVSIAENSQILIKGKKQKDNNNFIIFELCQIL